MPRAGATRNAPSVWRFYVIWLRFEAGVASSLKEVDKTEETPLAVPRPTIHWRPVAGALRSRYLAGVLLLAAAYYASAKLGQSLSYTASVSAIWPPAGVGIAALYLWGLRLWPGVFIAELVVNGQLLHSLPLGSLIGQQTGNLAEVLVGAWLLRRLIGPRAALDRPEQVGGLLVAIGAATAISAIVGTVSMLSGGVIAASEVPKFWRTWWLGDTAGGLVVVPLLLVWAPDPAAAWRRVRSWEGLFLVTFVTALAFVSVSAKGPVTYMVFPALILAAFRLGPPGATLAIAITALMSIGITAHEMGPFFRQPIDHRTLSTQLYIVVAALTTLLLSALVAERQRSAEALAEAHRREGERALEERRRIARDLHDSVSQALFSTALHTRTAEKALEKDGADSSGQVRGSLNAITELTKAAQAEMRAFIYELRRDAVEPGLVAALDQQARSLRGPSGLRIDVEGPDAPLGVDPRTEEELFAIGREALSNVARHAGARAATVRVTAGPGHVSLEVADDGRGFDATLDHPGHYGLESMRSRAADLGGDLAVASAPGAGTVIRVEVPVLSTTESDDGR
ncbi:MAG TPA: MASE1 domain-containing protein [Gaiellaceae bacterium]|nr:MASE1 domain-containing protein [Gaiellaceae bacterium]